MTQFPRIPTRRILVCGSAPRRDDPGRPGWMDWQTVWADLDRYAAKLDPSDTLTVIHGAAEGADTWAADWCQHKDRQSCGIEERPYPAEWKKFGRAAGPLRNRSMLRDGKPHLVLAYSTHWPLTPGAADMVTIALEEGVPALITVKIS